MKSGALVDVAITRNSVAINGKVNAALVTIGSISSVEIDCIQEPWMLARATSILHEYTGPDDKTWMGEIRAGDMIINVVKLEPIAAGSSTFSDGANIKLPVFDTDVRVLNLILAEVVMKATRHKPAYKRYTLSARDRDIVNSASGVVAD